MEKPLTEHIRRNGEPLSFEDYERVDGYASVRKALQDACRPAM